MATDERPRWLSRILGQERLPPRVPDGTRVYAIGDIHGRQDLLIQLLAQIWADADGRARWKSLIFLGDYVDRGPASKEVLDLLLALDWDDWDIVAIRGNHDQAILDFLQKPSFYRSWRTYGAADTFISYGVRPPSFDSEDEFVRARNEFAQKIPRSHLDFLERLPYSHTIGDYLFVHAGVRPGIALKQQSPQDLMWIRDEFLNSDRMFDKVVVHGHTPTNLPVMKPNRVGVDTGAYATGRLTAAVFYADRCKFLSTSGTADTESEGGSVAAEAPDV